MCSQVITMRDMAGDFNKCTTVQGYNKQAHHIIMGRKSARRLIYCNVHKHARQEAILELS